MLENTLGIVLPGKPGKGLVPLTETRAKAAAQMGVETITVKLVNQVKNKEMV